MDVVQKFMDWLGYDRVNRHDMDDGPVKYIYVKRGVNQISDEVRQNSSVREDAAAAARSHVGLTLVEQAILWIFESIRSLWSKPAESTTENSIINTNLPSETEIETEAEKEAKNQAYKISAAEEYFEESKNFIKSFIEKNDWPNSNIVFSEEVRCIAEIHWNTYKNLSDKSITTEADRLNYAAAAFVLGKNRPSFEPERKALEFPSPFVTDHPVIQEQKIILEDIEPQVSKGERLFLQFVQLYADKGFGELDSLGSPFFHPESLEFARKIIDEDNRIKKTFSTPPSTLEVDAANYLRKRKISLEGKAEENSRRQAERAKNEQIAKEKEQLRPGEWEFKQFVDKFVEFRDEGLRFILLKEKGYLANEKLLAFAATVKGNASTTSDQQQAADYLSKWSRDPDAATEAAQKKNGFSWPPEPPAPPPRTKRIAETEPDSISIKSGINTLPGQADSPPPSPPSTPRWMSTLSSMLKSASKNRDEMPEVFATMLMPNHGMEDRNLAWQGLYLLSSPPKNNLSSAVASENEATLSYQHNSVSANTDDLRRLELAERLIGFLQTLKIDEALKAVHVTRPSDEQIRAIRSLQKDASQIREELGSRIKALLPAKKTTAGLISKIPTIDSLNPSAFISASEDFNSFVKEFSSLSEQQNIQYQFVGGRAKYSRPNCAAIAQTVIASYKGLDPKDMMKEDRDRLSAAEFMISEFNKKNPST